MPRGALKVYSIHGHKGSHSCLGGVTYALGANDRGVTGAWESFVLLTPFHESVPTNRTLSSTGPLSVQ